MCDNYNQFTKRLENRTYRWLQQTAKSLNLPCNVKKIYLIELICTKKYCSEEDLKKVIKRVKLEQLTAVKNKNKQIGKFQLKSNKNRTLTSDKAHSPETTLKPPLNISPPIPKTLKTKIIHTTGRSWLKKLKNISRGLDVKANSDRVLRSFNVKCVKDQYQNKIMNEDSTTQKFVNFNTTYRSRQGNFLKTKCIIKKQKPIILNLNNRTFEKPVMSTPKELPHNSCTRIYQNRISCICPIVPLGNKVLNTQITSTPLCLVRNNDGSLRKINAYIKHRCITENRQCHNIYHYMDSNIQEVKNCQSNATSDKKENNAQMQPNIPRTPLQDKYTQTEINFKHFGVTQQLPSHSHDQLEQRRYEWQTKCRQNLPNINDAFTKFNKIEDCTQPLYVQVTTSPWNSTYPVYSGSSNGDTVVLEHLYNFENSTLNNNNSLLQIDKKAKTNTVYSTQTATTASVREPASFGSDTYNYNLYKQDSKYAEDPRLAEFILYCQALQPHTDNDSSTSSTEMYEWNNAAATITDMVEDALEFISQDGNYMERIAMEETACFLCLWMGPADELPQHVKTEHAAQLIKGSGGEWRVSCSLEALTHSSRTQILCHQDVLYVLRAQYRDPELLTVSLSSLITDPDPKIGVITIYNKLTGQPYGWSGYIQPHFNYHKSLGLQLDISNLDLLPNSAKVEHLYMKVSPSNVIDGPPALNDINIVMNIKIL